MGAAEDLDLVVECSRLEDGRVLVQFGDDWIIALTPEAGRVLAWQLHDVAGGLQYACSVLTPADAELMAS